MSNEIERLPAVHVFDGAGRRVALGELPGRLRLVQFVNPKVASRIASVSRLAAAFDPWQISFILITKNAGEFRARLPGLPQTALMVQE